MKPKVRWNFKGQFLRLPTSVLVTVYLFRRDSLLHALALAVHLEIPVPLKTYVNGWKVLERQVHLHFNSLLPPSNQWIKLHIHSSEGTVPNMELLQNSVICIHNQMSHTKLSTNIIGLYMNLEITTGSSVLTGWCTASLSSSAVN